MTSTVQVEILDTETSGQQKVPRLAPQSFQQFIKTDPDVLGPVEQYWELETVKNGGFVVVELFRSPADQLPVEAPHP
jgi:hypothetical protein